MKELINCITEKDFNRFLLFWSSKKSSLQESEKQNFLVEIMDNHYSNKDFSSFKKVFDSIIDSKVNLDFNIDHWAPTFLSLVILRCPGIELFNYFLKKGASINFIGDSLAFEEGENLEFEKKYAAQAQFMTCLDFTQFKLDDLLTVDYHFGTPPEDFQDYWSGIEDNEEITISKQEYLNLLEQSRYLNDLISTDRLLDHIKSLGGKTYVELTKK